MCLEEEVARKAEQGLSAAEISAATGLQREWVEEVISRLAAEGPDPSEASEDHPSEPSEP